MNKKINIWCSIGILSVLMAPVAAAQEDPQAREQLRQQAISATLDEFEPQDVSQAQEISVSAPPIVVTPAPKSVAQASSAPTQTPAPKASMAPAPVPPATAAASGNPSSYVPPVFSSPEDLKIKEQRVKVSGEVRTSAGFYSNGDVVFTRANADLNERNFRLLSYNQLNRGLNTYDPGLYSRLKVVMDAAVISSVSASVDVHLNITADPWSYTGKTKEQLVTGSFGDVAKVQYLYWGNTGYTVNQIYNTLRFGDAFALPEMKVKGNTVPPAVGISDFGDRFNIPAMKVDYTFFPLREAWVDIKSGDKKDTLRIFPMGYEDQALTSDDPLHLSNNHSWWEESPWLWDWKQGILNTGATPVDFTKGEWDRSLAFFTRDSDGLRLTALRGVSMFLGEEGDPTVVRATIASPKTLWQDYGVVTAVPASVRVKQSLGDNAYIGSIANAHQGFVNGERDAENYAGGFDMGVLPLQSVKITGQYSRSKSLYDETNPTYETKKQGNAYYGSLEASSNPDGLLNKDYLAVQPQAPGENLWKTKLYWARMDQGFESTLSTYLSTRSDSFWSRHLTFYPSDYRYLPGTNPSLSQYDLAPFAIGTGIDYGRQVAGWRADTNLMEGKLQGMADVRYVRTINDEPIETVSRTEWTLKPIDPLTTKLLFVDTELPKTVSGVDPFLVDSNGTPFLNTAVEAGKDPSVRTGSLGARYELTDWSAVNGVWEYTNDWTLGTNDFPQGILNSASFGTYTQNGRVYRQTLPFLYDQSFFDQAPYEYHNIFKAGFELKPTPIWHIYLDYTRNPNKFAGNIDDNMNHYGVETSIVPNKKFGIFARYTFSQWYDLNQLVNDNVLHYRGYHNFFLEGRYLFDKDGMISLQYGVGPAYNVSTSASDPNLAYYATTVVQTQHVVRLVVDKKF